MKETSNEAGTLRKPDFINTCAVGIIVLQQGKLFGRKSRAHLKL